MADISIPGRNKGFGVTMRTDNWRTAPFAVFLGLMAFSGYIAWAAFQGEYYWWSGGTTGFGGYLSPLYSPLIYIDQTAAGSAPAWHAWIGGPWPSWWPSILPASPAFLILAFPGAFRLTCYYYRKAYYRAFAATPPACAVGGIPQKPFKGETGLLIFQNLHRYALYFALIFVVILSYDAVLSFFNDGQFGVGVGSIVLLINPILIGAYTFGCHSFRHLVGGKMDCMSCSMGRYKTWKKVSLLNSRHQLFAWLSLFWVSFADFYVRMVSAGYIKDLNTWGL